MKRILNSSVVRRTSDVLLSPLTLFSSIWHKYIRSASTDRMPVSEKIFMKVGVLPVNDHYYQPLINPVKHLRHSLADRRRLPGIEWNLEEQFNLMSQFHYNDELLKIPFEKAASTELHYYFNNPSFRCVDGEFAYNVIRHFKPRKVIEIGCGYSTLLCLHAEKRNSEDGQLNKCEHICVEPYEMDWLEKSAAKVIRKRVEELDSIFFDQLEANDILFIDSSHIIRPQGDVLFEFLEILPTLKKGVIVHVHDVFTPYDYPQEWIVNNHWFWNEQYLLEAFLTFNREFRIIGAVHLLKKEHSHRLYQCCPNSALRPSEFPGSFWMIKN